MKVSMRRGVSTLMLSAIVAIALAMAVPTAGAGEGGKKLINVNSAGVEELIVLPGVGRAYAERIVEYREKNGPFKKVEDLLNVKGIGEKTFERIRSRVTVGKS